MTSVECIFHALRKETIRFQEFSLSFFNDLAVFLMNFRFFLFIIIVSSVFNDFFFSFYWHFFGRKYCRLSIFQCFSQRSLLLFNKSEISAILSTFSPLPLLLSSSLSLSFFFSVPSLSLSRSVLLLLRLISFSFAVCEFSSIFQSPQLIDFCFHLFLPKQHLKRTGWVLRDVGDCETIAGHMYRMGLMTFLLDGQSNNNLDRTKCMELGKWLGHHDFLFIPRRIFFSNFPEFPKFIFSVGAWFGRKYCWRYNAILWRFQRGQEATRNGCNAGNLSVDSATWPTSHGIVRGWY